MMENPVLASISQAAFLQHMENLASRVENAINPLQKTKEELKSGLSDVSNRVTSIEANTNANKSQITRLQEQMNSFRRDLDKVTSSQLSPCEPSILAPPPRPSPRSDPSTGQQYSLFSTLHIDSTPQARASLTNNDEATQVIKDARRILGFSPISMTDIDYLRRQKSLQCRYA